MLFELATANVIYAVIAALTVGLPFCVAVDISADGQIP